MLLVTHTIDVVMAGVVNWDVVSELMSKAYLAKQSDVCMQAGVNTATI